MTRFAASSAVTARLSSMWSMLKHKFDADCTFGGESVA